MNFSNNEVKKTINQATLDELHMLMQRFPRVITGMNALEFLEYQGTTDDKFSAYFDEDHKPMHINHMRHQLSMKLIYTLATLVLNTLQNLLKFYF